MGVNRGLLINILLTLLVVTVSATAVLLPGESTPELGQINKQAPESIQPIKVGKELQPLPKAETVVDEKIPERVYCGSPKQGSWKNIDVHNATIGKGLASDKGWSGSEWIALLELWACESSWKATVANYEGSGAYGIPQSLPASKMASHGEDYLSNPTTQIKWGLDYIANRYKSPSKALEFHYAMNWY